MYRLLRNKLLDDIVSHKQSSIKKISTFSQSRNSRVEETKNAIKKDSKNSGSHLSSILSPFPSVKRKPKLSHGSIFNRLIDKKREVKLNVGNLE